MPMPVTVDARKKNALTGISHTGKGAAYEISALDVADAPRASLPAGQAGMALQAQKNEN